MTAFREVCAYVAGPNVGKWVDSMGTGGKFSEDRMLSEVVAPILADGWRLVVAVPTENIIRFLFQKG